MQKTSKKPIICNLRSIICNNKVIFITRESYKQAGARVRCYKFAEELKKRGYEARVLSFADHLGAKSGVLEAELSLLEKLKYNWQCFLRLKKYKNSIFILQRMNYHCFGVLLAYFLTNNKLILDIDDWEMREDHAKSKAAKLIKFIAKKADYCIAASNYLYEFLSPYAKRIEYIPSAVALEKSRALADKSASNSHANRIILCWVGTLYRKHDVENVKFALECFVELFTQVNNKNNVFFEIAGTGIYENDIIQFVDSLNCKNIRYLGWVAPDSIGQYLDKIDIGLMPLIQNTKFNLSKSPTKLFEYMSYAKPTVSTRVGEAEYIIENGVDGFLADDKQAFIGKMKLLVESEQLRFEIGKNARLKIEQRYNIKCIGDKFNDILEEISPAAKNTGKI